MDGAKKLTGLELDNYQYPLADVSHLSEEEKKELLNVECVFLSNLSLTMNLNSGFHSMP